MTESRSDAEVYREVAGVYGLDAEQADTFAEDVCAAAGDQVALSELLYREAGMLGQEGLFEELGEGPTKGLTAALSVSYSAVARTCPEQQGSFDAIAEGVARASGLDY